MELLAASAAIGTDETLVATGASEREVGCVKALAFAKEADAPESCVTGATTGAEGDTATGDLVQNCEGWGATVLLDTLTAASVVSPTTGI